ncbi:MAG TPA: T9SS type A sorting domain-containing protein [Bacteroidia bacterium]|nr:T9SS type A sorting domain-containing protein [Bacteroidia bacterium]
MRKQAIWTAIFVLILNSIHLEAQCLFASPYGSAIINNTTPGYSVTITTCQFAGEYAPLTFNVTGAFTFSSSVASDYFTLTNASNSVIASGNNPLNAVIPTTGTYYLHTAASGPTACATQNACRTTRVLVPYPPCSGTPVTGTVSAFPSVICPAASATLSLPGSSTGSGLMYQWYASTSGPSGPYSLVPGAGAATVISPPGVTVTTWYKAVMACTNSAQTATSLPVSVGIAGTTTNSIPYYESFENLIVDNQLPNCSWKASNLPQTCQTYVASNTNNRIPRTGSKFAAFYYQPAGNSYFYTNGLYLQSGVTYSASVWYTTEYNTYATWTNLDIMLGPNQSTLGLQTVASTNGTAASPSYKSLSNTFTVASTGIYYLALKASSFGPCCAQYLCFDDISVTVPCALNIPPASINASNDSICAGESVVFTAVGASSYTWNNGSNSPSITLSPTSNTIVSVAVAGPYSACTSTLSKAIAVLPVNPVSVYASAYTVCPGDAVYLSAFGASSYSWSMGSTGQAAVVYPTTAGSYSVIGSNAYGCTSQASLNVSVFTIPVLTASASRTLACKGETITLNAFGAQNYFWYSNSNLFYGQQVNVPVTAPVVYTLNGTNQYGCSSQTQLFINAEECTGLMDQEHVSGTIRLFPNPGQGNYTILYPNTGPIEILLCDLDGKAIYRAQSNSSPAAIRLDESVPQGVYVLKLISNGITRVMPLIKQ